MMMVVVLVKVELQEGRKQTPAATEHVQYSEMK